MSRPETEVAVASVSTSSSDRLADYRELSKPRITLMVVLTSMAGFLLARPIPVDLTVLIATLVGTALSCAGAGALNMVLERQQDALMVRTQMRPLPAGRLRTREAALFSLAMIVGGLAILALGANGTAAAVAGVTVLSYNLLYTPLKLRMSSAVLVGAVPGALPPVIGWAGATGSLTTGALAIFSVLFFWQLPHFLAIDWLYREDYRKAGFRTVAVGDPGGGRTAVHAVLSTLLLLPVSLLPVMAGVAGRWYLMGALVLGAGYLAASVRLALARTNAAARGLILASVVYLPLVFLVMVLDRV